MSDFDYQDGCFANHNRMRAAEYAEHIRENHGVCGEWTSFIGRDLYCSVPAGQEHTSDEHVYTRSGMDMDQSQQQYLDRYRSGDADFDRLAQMVQAAEDNHQKHKSAS